MCITTYPAPIDSYRAKCVRCVCRSFHAPGAADQRHVDLWLMAVESRFSEKRAKTPRPRVCSHPLLLRAEQGRKFYCPGHAPSLPTLESLRSRYLGNLEACGDGDSFVTPLPLWQRGHRSCCGTCRKGQYAVYPINRCLVPESGVISLPGAGKPKRRRQGVVEVAGWLVAFVLFHANIPITPRQFENAKVRNSGNAIA